MTEQLSCVPRVWEVRSSNPSPAKSYTALQTVRHRFNIYASSCVALVWRWASRTRYTPRHNTASIVKGLVCILILHIVICCILYLGLWVAL